MPMGAAVATTYTILTKYMCFIYFYLYYGLGPKRQARLPNGTFLEHATIEHQTVSDRELSSKMLKPGRRQEEVEKEKDKVREREKN